MPQQRNFWERIRPWALEAGATILSLVLLSAMVAVLSSFDRRPVFDSGVVTLNAVVSVLSTASKALLLFVLANTVSQWNWILFNTRRRLVDFERVAQASRGPYGSLKLLFNSNFRQRTGIIRIGALITILAVALDPFAQQLVQLDRELRYTIDNQAQSSLSLATRYSQGNSFGTFGAMEVTPDGQLWASSRTYADAEFSLQSAVMFGIVANRSVISQQVAFSCPSGECKFLPVMSLAVCSRCEDLTDRLEKNTLSNGALYFDLIRDGSFAEIRPNSTEYRLPNGLFLNNFDESSGGSRDMVYMSMLGTANRTRTVTAGDLDTLIWAQTMIKVGNRELERKWPDFDIVATECALYYCVRNYTAEVHNTTLFETSAVLEDKKRLADSWQIVESNIQIQNLSQNIRDSIAFHPVQSLLDRTDLQLGAPGEDVAWNVSQNAVNGISSFMQDTFTSCMPSANCTEVPVVDEWGPVNGYMIARSGAGGVWLEQYEPSVARTLWMADSLNETFFNIAMSMSNAIRNGADGAEVRNGSIGIFETVYAVEWPWIALHALVVLGTIIFFVSTISSTGEGGHIPVWKDSQLAVFSQGYLVDEHLRDARSLGEFEKKAKRVPVTLGHDRRDTTLHDQGAPFVGSADTAYKGPAYDDARGGNVSSGNSM